MYSQNRGPGNIIAVIIVLGILAVVFTSCQKMLGVGGWGPVNTVDVKVTRTYVDTSKDSDGDTTSHYMVATEQGVYEVDNGVLLGVSNADEIYGKMQAGRWYRITTKGKKRVNWFMQEYPYITAVQPLSDKAEATDK